MARSPKRSALVPSPRKKLSRDDLSGHHPEVAAAIEPSLVKADRETDTLLSIGVALAAMRDDAVQARKNSGIEDIWRRCEEAYVGIDDANRAEFASMRWAKPMDSSGPVTTGTQNRSAYANKSNIFLRLTSRYVDAAYAKVAEIIVPPDDKAFSFTETPVPDLIEARNDRRIVRHEVTGEPLTRPLMPGETPPGQPAAAMAPPEAAQGPAPGTSQPAPIPAAGAPPGSAAPAPLAPAAGGAAGPPVGGPPTPPLPGDAPAQNPGAQRVPLTVADLAEEAIQLNRKKAKKAETRIYDWMVETQDRAECRKSIFDAARLGVGVMKGPVPKIKKSVATKRGEDGRIQVIFKEKIIPESVSVSPWNAFPDPTCGENFQNGSHFFERDWVSEKQLRDLSEEPGYIKDAILKIIKEGPDKIHQKRENGEQIDSSTQDSRKGRYEIWYFHGWLKKSDLNCICQASGYVGDQSSKRDDEMIPVIATMVNEKIIKAVPSVLESGKLPYHSMPWTRRPGHWAGTGVAEQVNPSQRMLNASNRSMLNNAGKSSGSQIVVDQTAIRPANGDWTMTPDKIWYKTGEAIGAIKDVFEIYEIPNVTKQMLEIIKFSLQTAEEASSIPLITQGQSGRDMAPLPETLGHAQLQNTNANQLLRSIGYTWDDNITEPRIIAYYEYLLLDPDVPDDEKGDFNIDAHGSVAMVERAIQDATIAQLGPLTKDPAFGMDPKRWSTQMIKSKKLNPADFKYSKEEQAKLDAMPPPEDPRIGAARVTMQGWVAEANVKKESDLKKVQVEAVTELHKLEMQREIALLGYANQHKISLAEVQSQLTQTAIKVAAEERLNEQNNANDLHKHHNPSPRPAVQAPGRAKNGQAASQNT